MKYEIINIVDLECTCWKDERPVGSMSEIIEISIAGLEVKTGKIIPSDQNMYVYPNNSKVSEFCYNLTGISQKTLDDSGIPFSVACQILLNRFKSKYYIWASYGGYDLRMFEDQCLREHIDYPFGGKHINVKTLFALKYKLDNEVGMAEALKILNIPLEGKHHSGRDDALNIAKILREILK